MPSPIQNVQKSLTQLWNPHKNWIILIISLILYFLLVHKKLVDICRFASVYVPVGSAKANGREPWCCLDQVFSFKLGRFVMYAIAQHLQTRPRLELKTRPKFCPVSLSLPMLRDSSPHCTFSIEIYFQSFLSKRTERHVEAIEAQS